MYHIIIIHYACFDTSTIEGIIKTLSSINEIHVLYVYTLSDCCIILSLYIMPVLIYLISLKMYEVLNGHWSGWQVSLDFTIASEKTCPMSKHFFYRVAVEPWNDRLIHLVGRICRVHCKGNMWSFAVNAVPEVVAFGIPWTYLLILSYHRYRYVGVR